VNICAAQSRHYRLISALATKTSGEKLPRKGLARLWQYIGVGG
jgi:hypothetical protein